MLLSALVRNPIQFPDQDRFGKSDNPAGQRGNCHQVCLASVLGLPVDEVPHFFDTDETPELQNVRRQRWLAERGWVSLWVPWNWIGSDWIDLPSEALVIASGKSPRGDWAHAVIAQLKEGTLNIVHDPHPSKTGLDGTPYGLYVVSPMPCLRT